MPEICPKCNCGLWDNLELRNTPIEFWSCGQKMFIPSRNADLYIRCSNCQHMLHFETRFASTKQDEQVEPEKDLQYFLNRYLEDRNNKTLERLISILQADYEVHNVKKLDEEEQQMKLR
jgi:hypothetical protein